MLQSRMRGYLLLIGLMLVSFTAQAQKANFEAAQRFTEDRMEKMTGDTQVNPQWIEDQDRFWYSYENPTGTHWYFVDAEDGEKSPLFNRKEMAAQLSETFSKTFNHKKLELGDFEYNVKDGLFTFHVDSINFKYKLENNELIKGDSLKEESNERWATYSPDSSWIAYAKNHNLYLMNVDDPDSTEYQLTDDGERWYSFQADAGDTTSNKKLQSVAEWFEDSNKLYAKRTDQRDVE